MVLVIWGCSTQTLPMAELQVPQAIQNAFNTQFPLAKQVKWEKESSDVFEAEFKDSGKKMSANFDVNGAWLETETEIKVADLPQMVKDAIAQSFVGFKIEEAETVEKPETSLAYEVELENDQTDEEIEAVFDANGNLLSSESEDDEEDGNDEDGD